MVDRAALEMRCSERNRGFESLPLRHCRRQWRTSAAGRNYAAIAEPRFLSHERRANFCGELGGGSFCEDSGNDTMIFEETPYHSDVFIAWKADEWVPWSCVPVVLFNHSENVYAVGALE